MAPTKKTSVKKTVAKKVSTKKPVAPKTATATDTEKNIQAPVYDASGKEVRTIALPSNIFGAKRNDVLVFQVVTAMEANARVSIAHTKGRGEVRGGGRKPWKQKGTGRARHGSRRSPIWRGGGVTHGPTSEKDYSQKLNKKMRTGALAAVLSHKLRNGEVLFVEAPSFKEPKTQEAKTLLVSLAKVKGFETLATRRNNAALVAFGEKNEMLEKSLRNIGSVSVEESRNLNPADVLAFRYLVITNPEATLDILKKRMKTK